MPFKNPEFSYCIQSTPVIRGVDPQKMPKTADSTEPCIDYAFPYRHRPLIKFSLQIRPSERLTVTNKKIKAIIIYSIRSYMTVVSLSKYLTVPHSPLFP